MRVLQGRNQNEIGSDAFRQMASGYSGVDLDIGTGDGGFVLDRARAHPHRLVVGLDPVPEAMADAASRITRKKSRRDNVLFVVGSVERMPGELDGLVENVFVNFPWGSLMRGLIVPDQEVLKALARVGAPGAAYRIILNLRIFDNPVPLDARDLPEVTVQYVEDELRPSYREAGLDIVSVDEVGPDDLQRLRTSWARRLSHRAPPPSIQIHARKL